jgi:hypothetical protein
VDCPVRECIYGEIKEPCKSCSKGKAVKEKLERAMEAKALEFEKFGLEFLEKPAGVHGRYVLHCNTMARSRYLQVLS